MCLSDKLAMDNNNRYPSRGNYKNLMAKVSLVNCQVTISSKNTNILNLPILFL